MVAGALILPYTPLAGLFGFEPLTLEFLGMIGLIMVLYIASAELAKEVFLPVQPALREDCECGPAGKRKTGFRVLEYLGRRECRTAASRNSWQGARVEARLR